MDSKDIFAVFLLVGMVGGWLHIIAACKREFDRNYQIVPRDRDNPSRSAGKE